MFKHTCNLGEYTIKIQQVLRCRRSLFRAEAATTKKKETTFGHTRLKTRGFTRSMNDPEKIFSCLRVGFIFVFLNIHVYKNKNNNKTTLLRERKLNGV